MTSNIRGTNPPLAAQIAEEAIIVTKREIATGKVRITTHTDVVEQLVRERLESETMEVTHVTCNREIDAIPPVRTEGDVTILSVVEEVLFVEKRLVLKEEIHLRRRRVSETAEITVPLRRQRADVERLEAGKTDTPEIKIEEPR